MCDFLVCILLLWFKDYLDYGFFLGMYVFGLEEFGEFVKVEDFGWVVVDCNL